MIFKQMVGLNSPLGKRGGKTEINLGGGLLLTGLTLIFTTAKLWGVIDWSWWWVFAPIWISVLIAISSLIFVLFVALCIDKWDRFDRRLKKK